MKIKLKQCWSTIPSISTSHLKSFITEKSTTEFDDANQIYQEKIMNRYIMFGRGICEKYYSRDEKFPEPKGE
jgi:hypothetical protein